MTATESPAGLTGRTLFPGQPGFEEEKATFNLCVEHTPSVIVRAQNQLDVQAAVRYAAGAGRPVAVQATGHGIGAAADGAVLISTRAMRGVRVYPDALVARFEAGALWSDVVAATAEHGLAPLVGSTPNVSAVGYHTGGGLPVLGRAHGCAADHVRGFDLVTADGRLRHVYPDTEPELFWAVRGGKSNFGVVVSMEIDLFPIKTVYGGRLTYLGADSDRVFEAWRDWTATAPEAMATAVMWIRFPDLPQLPEPIRGQYLFFVTVGFAGDAEEGARLIAPLRALGPILDTVTALPHSRIGEVYDDPTDPGFYVEAGGLLRTLDDEALKRILAAVGPDAEQPPFALNIRLLGGALARTPARPSAVSHRDAEHIVMVFGLAPDASLVPPLTTHARAVLASLEPALTGGVLPNWLGTDTTAPEEVARAYSAADWERLRAVKRAVDPGNMFRINHNIPPLEG
ncbi:FAD-binding oxidoreductase [Catenulispora subtropica]|uniref:FAD-binding oxidoreductase n=1 Tax=Catenulispora subtropica TaxID=450798 RepID=A0ABN2RIT2_9ACTN